MSLTQEQRENLRCLVSKRGTFKASCTKFSKFVSQFEDVARLVELRIRCENIKQIFNQFSEVQGQIELLDESQSHERDTFEDTYFKAVAAATSIIENHKQTSAQQSVSSESQSINSMQSSYYNDPNLPKINLPNFDGKFDEWYKFSRTFKAIVDSNPRLDDTRKFHYLQSALKGKAANVIDALDSSSANYKDAWDLLEARYENSTRIIFNHVKAILDLEPIRKNSYDVLREFVDTFLKHLNALEGLKIPVNHWDIILIQLLFNKLDYSSQREWKIEVNKLNKNLPTLKEFKKFLDNRCDLLESLDKTNSVKKPQVVSQQKTLAHISTTNNECPLCKDKHLLYACPQFSKLNNNEKWREIKRMQLCSNCFRNNHFAKTCRSSNCKLCNKKHNTLLHEERIPSENIESTAGSSSSLAHVSQNLTPLVLLSTAIILIKNNHNQSIQARALLDSGSQSNFITKGLARKINLPMHKINNVINGVASAKTNISHSTEAIINSCVQDFSAKLSFLVLDQITTNIPSITFNPRALNIPGNIELADKHFYKSDHVDILLGQTIFLELLSEGQIKLGPNQPVLQNSKLGWFVGGPINLHLSINTTCHLVNNDELSDQIERFWQIEEVGTSVKLLSNEELECEREFEQTHKRDSNGRFIVNLPLKSSPACIGNSVKRAVRRFHTLEKQLSKNDALRSEYSMFLQEYEHLNHMTEIVNPKELIKDEGVFYLPHHAVIKESSSTTRVRVVFDASAKGSLGMSLNNVLKVGPTIQEDLLSILLRFRQHMFVLTGDIAKMYRQVLVNESQRDLQRIVWRESADLPLKHYRLNTLTYGTASASFLAIRCCIN